MPDSYRSESHAVIPEQSTEGVAEWLSHKGLQIIVAFFWVDQLPKLQKGQKKPVLMKI